MHPIGRIGRAEEDRQLPCSTYVRPPHRSSSATISSSMADSPAQ
jgi:hypothetical protein